MPDGFTTSTSASPGAPGGMLTVSRVGDDARTSASAPPMYTRAPASKSLPRISDTELSPAGPIRGTTCAMCGHQPAPEVNRSSYGAASGSPFGVLRSVLTATRSAAFSGSGPDGRNTSVLVCEVTDPASSVPGTGWPSAVKLNALTVVGSMAEENTSVSDGRSTGTTSPACTLAYSTWNSVGKSNSTDQPRAVPRSRSVTMRPPAIATARASPPAAPATL